MREKRWKSAPVLLATMMVSTAYETKLESTWSSCEEEIRQYPEKAWPLISPRTICGLDLGGRPHMIRMNHKQHDDFEEVQVQSKACHTGLFHLVGFSPKRLHLRSLVGRLMLHVG
jgi:hypothetical protein